MLKTGLHLLFYSSLDFFYVNADFAYSMNPALKWSCLAGLTCSVVCFIATYIRAVAPAHSLNHMVRFAAWKTSSTH